MKHKAYKKKKTKRNRKTKQVKFIRKNLKGRTTKQVNEFYVHEFLNGKEMKK